MNERVTLLNVSVMTVKYCNLKKLHEKQILMTQGRTYQKEKCAAKQFENLD